MAVMLLTIILAAAIAVPVPEHGTCPSSYRSQASYCDVPMDERSPVAIPKVGQCPSTMMQSGNYCIDKRQR